METEKRAGQKIVDIFYQIKSVAQQKVFFPAYIRVQEDLLKLTKKQERLKRNAEIAKALGIKPKGPQDELKMAPGTTLPIITNA